MNWRDITKSYTLSLIRLAVVLVCIIVFSVIRQPELTSWFVLACYLLFQISLTLLKPKYGLWLSHWVDLIGFGLLLALNTSAMNGAISILYVPIISASILLTSNKAWPVTFAAVLIYTGLIWSASAYSEHHMMAGHLQGMWVTFVFSAIAMTWFMSAQRSHLIRQRSEISDLKEQQMRDEQILAVATYAANTAHQLSTPLFTMGLLTEEIKSFEPGQDEFEVINQLDIQLDRCQQIVRNIAQQAKLQQASMHGCLSFVERICQLWWNRRNEIEVNTHFSDKLAQFQLSSDLNLEMAILNLLDNAADASLSRSSTKLDLNADVIDNHMVISIQDYGSGFDMAKMEKLGLQAASDKDVGMGIGLILANAAIERNEGTIVLNNNDKGALTQIRLPVSG